MKKYAIVFLAWGEQYIDEVVSCLQHSNGIEQYDTILLTEKTTPAAIDAHFTCVIRVTFQLSGLIRKTELLDHLPEGYDAYLFLDSDTRVLKDIHLGFRKAEEFGVALAPAPHYSLDNFFGFDTVMQREGVPLEGQLQFNTGVIFFHLSPEVVELFREWNKLASRHIERFQNDQPFLSLAMEQLSFNPYTLSISYNYRGFGDAISGLVRIWHSREGFPEGVNDNHRQWPARKATKEGVFPFK